ncbi:MAG: hypothetical protein Q7S35_10375, partial [Candidatus Limnocylindrales bacterium]|nr:hypothetical protein [Candidatus Limnocylindrales bacterium]
MPPSRHPNDLAELIRRRAVRTATEVALAGGAPIIVPGSGLEGDLDEHLAQTDPHTGYVKESEFGAKGDLLGGSGAGTLVRLPIGTGYLVPAPSAASGMAWVQEVGVLELVIDGAQIPPT